jgi:hypothetical protein
MQKRDVGHPTRTHRLENVGSGVLLGESETFLVDICVAGGTTEHVASGGLTTDGSLALFDQQTQLTNRDHPPPADSLGHGHTQQPDRS